LENSAKIKALVIPDLFPDEEDRIKGIFMLSYLGATEKFCNNVVLVLKLFGQNKGLKNGKYLQSNIIHYTFSNNKISKLLKPFYYFKYFRKGTELGKSLADVSIIHAHGSILSGTIAWLLSRKLKIPFVITEHVGPFSVVTGNSWKYKWTKFIIQKASAVLCVSEHSKNEIIKAGIKIKKAYITYNPVNTELFIPLPEKENNILFVGRLDNFKGALRTVKAFHSVYKKYPGWKLVIVGEGEDLNPIRQFLEKDSSYEKTVVLKGNLNRQDLAKEMAQSKFLVFPSLHETFGLVAAEALSCGTPVIAANVTGPSEFVHSENGCVVDPLDEKQISLAIEKMITDHSQFNSEQIRNEVISRFGYDSFGGKLRDIYSATISNFKK